MATVTATQSTVADGPGFPVVKVVWTPLTSTNADGSVVLTANMADRSVQVAGTFDSATATLQGRNDGTNWATLTDPLGNNIALTSAGLVQILQLTQETRILTAGGGGSQSLTVTMIGRKTRA